MQVLPTPLLSVHNIKYSLLLDPYHESILVLADCSDIGMLASGTDRHLDITFIISDCRYRVGQYKYGRLIARL